MSRRKITYLRVTKVKRSEFNYLKTKPSSNDRKIYECMEFPHCRSQRPMTGRATRNLFDLQPTTLGPGDV